jgi:hypothetical protein
VVQEDQDADERGEADRDAALWRESSALTPVQVTASEEGAWARSVSFDFNPDRSNDRSGIGYAPRSGAHRQPNGGWAPVAQRHNKRRVGAGARTTKFTVCLRTHLKP